MADLTYKVPEPPPRPFRPGDTIEVLDREFKIIGKQKVVMASARIWRQDGYRLDDDNRAWPFPSIRLAQ